jgi:SSS family solute:Na+ symporter
LYIGIAASVLFTGWAVLTSTPMGAEKKILLDMGDWNYSHHKYMLGVYSHFVLFIVAYIASYFFKTNPVEENLTIYGWLKKKSSKENEPGK